MSFEFRVRPEQTLRVLLWSINGRARDESSNKRPTESKGKRTVRSTAAAAPERLAFTSIYRSRRLVYTVRCTRLIVCAQELKDVRRWVLLLYETCSPFGGARASGAAALSMTARVGLGGACEKSRKIKYCYGILSFPSKTRPNGRRFCAMGVPLPCGRHFEIAKHRVDIIYMYIFFPSHVRILLCLKMSCFQQDYSRYYSFRKHV